MHTKEKGIYIESKRWGHRQNIYMYGEMQGFWQPTIKRHPREWFKLPCNNTKIRVQRIVGNRNTNLYSFKLFIFQFLILFPDREQKFHSNVYFEEKYLIEDILLSIQNKVTLRRNFLPSLYSLCFRSVWWGRGCKDTFFLVFLLLFCKRKAFTIRSILCILISSAFRIESLAATPDFSFCPVRLISCPPPQ